MDISQLQVEKRQLKDKIAEMERQQKELSEILIRKKLEKTKTLGPTAINPYNTVAVDGRPVSDFRHPRSTNNASLAAIPPPQKDLLKAIPINKSSKVAKLRIQTIKKQIDHEVIAASSVVDIFDNRKRAMSASSAPTTIGKVPASLFPNRYKRGELPCSMEHGTTGPYLSWVCPLEKLDYEHYLPLFFDGLQCKGIPLAFLASQGTKDMLQAARGAPERVIPCIPLIILPIRNVLCKKDPVVLLPLLQCLRELVNVGEGVGATLVNSGVTFLSLFNIFLDKTRNIGDAIDYRQRRLDDVGMEVLATLEELERHGGPHAFRRIKHSIPTYESCLPNDKGAIFQTL